MDKTIKSNLYQIVFFCYILVWLMVFESFSSTNLALIRYALSLFIFYKIILEVKYNRNNLLINKNLLILFILWTGIMVARNFTDIFSSSSNYINIKRFLNEELLIYSFPLLIITNIQLDELKKIIKLNLLFAVVYLFLSIIFFSFFTDLSNENLQFLFNAEAFIVFFPSTLILILFTSSYHSLRTNSVNIFIIIFALYVSILLGRRNKALFFSTALILAVYLVIFSTSLISKKKRANNSVIIFIVLIIVTVFSYINIEKFDFFIERTETGIESREDIIDEFFSDFNNHPSDWLWGRGFHGTFLSRSLSISDLDNSRDLIENGYLFAILKGGILYVILLFIITSLSFYYGFLNSKNLLSKSMALLLILYLIDLIGYGLPTISFKYMVIFIAIAVCNSPQINKMSDLDIIQKLQLK